MNFVHQINLATKTNITAFFIFLLFSGCSNAQPKPKFLEVLNNKSAFNLLSGNPLSNKYGEVDAIKVVYEIETNKIYYLNSKNYKYHHGFCSMKLGYNKGLEEFNLKNYSEDSKQRSYLLGNINYYHSINKYVMDLSPADLIQLKDIDILYQKIAASSYVKNELTLLLNTSRLLNLKKEFKIPTITPELIYQNQKYQAISISEGYGYLRFVSLKDLKQNVYNTSDILVLQETPNIIPMVSGIISSEFQTPLSHLSILGRNRNIPIMAYKNASEIKKLLSLKDQFVVLKVMENGYTIHKANPDDKKHNQSHKKRLNLQKDLSIDTLVDFSNIKKVSAKSIGNKAKNFAILQHLSERSFFKVPESAFAVPFYFYEQHLETSKAGILIKQLLIDYEENADSIDLASRLKQIRKAIKSTPINPELLEQITLKAKKLGNYESFRFRSSTNAEDMKGFGGAGLYTSKTGVIGDTSKSIEAAIQKVWASLWNIQAFNERQYFNINQQKVAMGILVHRSFPNEIANGVAITKNIYRESNLGCVINVQLGNESVVEPKKGVTCDQVICYESSANKIYTEKDIIEVITKSSLNNNELIMTDQEIIHLVQQLEIIKKYYYNRDSDNDFAGFGLDVEFKLDANERTLYIKQVRYYND
jgi:pyruvate, water dikinase